MVIFYFMYIYLLMLASSTGLLAGKRKHFWVAYVFDWTPGFISTANYLHTSPDCALMAASIDFPIGTVISIEIAWQTSNNSS